MADQHLYEENRKQAELIHHFTNLFGYTQSAVSQAITEIREDAGDDPTDLQKMLLTRADEMATSLEAIREEIG